MPRLDHFYPFEGHLEDIEMDAKGTTINVPLPAATGGDVYRRAWAELVLPVLVQFEPDWVLVSAGFDAHASDELAGLSLQSSDYGWMAHRLARVHPPNRTLFALEGGYDLTALRESASAVLRGMSGEDFELDPYHSPDGAVYALSRAAEAIGRHWQV